ncbi:uncharacterized protein LOC132281422 [Cornus florida]|uniref:uncharacterized protein LOC132281422 n=1 Tax=Cornus florida TaxID=4283 RepID=UPI00289919D5|nr:uncharacterized protein LOC132281422 [Cornus florida]
MVYRVGMINGCPNLAEVYLRRRCQVGNFGVISLVDLVPNLTTLDLTGCIRIADEALKAIGNARSLQVLILRGCWLITNTGLALLASGSLSRTLRELDIAECNRITDDGLLHLREMCCLEELNLANCGLDVTNTGGVAIAAIQTLKRLSFSWLINISDATLIALAQNCPNLVYIGLRGCESITRVMAFVPLQIIGLWNHLCWLLVTSLAGRICKRWCSDAGP